MKVQYDKQADALYIYLAPGPVKKTVRGGRNVLVDLDEKNRIVGVEFYKISRSVPKEKLRNISIELPTLTT